MAFAQPPRLICSFENRLLYRFFSLSSTTYDFSIRFSPILRVSARISLDYGGRLPKELFRASAVFSRLMLRVAGFSCLGICPPEFTFGGCRHQAISKKMDRDKMEGIRGAVLEAYRVYADELSRTALALTRNKALAQDVLQETFLRYFVTRMHGDEISDEGRWPDGVMRSLIQDWKKSAVGQEAVALEEVEDTAEQTPQDKGFGNRQRTLPAWAARILAPREQECIELRSQGLAYSEIASAMQISIGTVGALLNRAIGKLRHTLPISEGVK